MAWRDTVAVVVLLSCTPPSLCSLTLTLICVIQALDDVLLAKIQHVRLSIDRQGLLETPYACGQSYALAILETPGATYPKVAASGEELVWNGHYGDIPLEHTFDRRSDLIRLLEVCTFLDRSFRYDA